MTNRKSRSKRRSRFLAGITEREAKVSAKEEADSLRE
jgi:hypothetical protein